MVPRAFGSFVSAGPLKAKLWAIIIGSVYGKETPFAGTKVSFRYALYVETKTLNWVIGKHLAYSLKPCSTQ